MGAYSSERRPWGRINALCSHSKSTILSRNLDQNMLKNALFLRKKLKKSPQLSGDNF